MKKIIAGAMLFLMGSAIADKETDARLDKLMGPATHQQYHQFLENLQHAVAIADKRSVAAMIDYPVTVSVNGQPVFLANKQDFINNFDYIFNEKLKK
ncbi:hypothetical protein [Erwinia sp. OPT-41]|uniref:Periplasmic protein n=1 Tax=Erwinia plantamica TaxID=3237104 RepID=A0ABW7CMA0_9GAMM